MTPPPKNTEHRRRGVPRLFAQGPQTSCPNRALVVVDTLTSVKPNLSQCGAEPMAPLWVPAALAHWPFPGRCCIPTIMPRLPILCFPPSSASVILPLQAQRVSSSHPWPCPLCSRLQDHSRCSADLMPAFTYKPQLCLVSIFSLCWLGIQTV